MRRYLTIAQRDALDEQDRQNGWGRYEQVLCSDGIYRYRWQLQIAAAERQARETLRTGAGLLHGRYVR